jgi:hypothetical protein
MLEAEGFKLKTTSLEKAGKRVYFLKIDALYKKEDAEMLGKDISLLYPELGGYWLEKIVLEKEPISEEKIGSEEIVSVEEETSLEEKIKTFPADADLYEMQVLANTDSFKISQKSQILQDAGYKTKVITAEVNGVLYYRLRIDNLFTLEEGQIEGERLVDRFEFIEGYWLDKVKS